MKKSEFVSNLLFKNFIIQYFIINFLMTQGDILDQQNFEDYCKCAVDASTKNPSTFDFEADQEDGDHQQCFAYIPEQVDQDGFEVINYTQTDIKAIQLNLSQHVDSNNQEEYINETKKRQYDQVFFQANIKDKCSKNTNMPKFYMRLFKQYIGHSNIHDIRQFTQYLMVDFDRRAHFNLNDLKKTFNNQKCSKHQNKIVRQQMRRILRSKLMKQILQSNYVRNKFSHLIASKVYALRMINSVLCTRLKSR